jgi:hypothetical protein
MSSVQNKFLKIQKVEWAVVPPDLGGGENVIMAVKQIKQNI